MGSSNTKLHALVDAVQALSAARDLTTVSAIVRAAARDLTESDRTALVLSRGRALDEADLADAGTLTAMDIRSRPIELEVARWAQSSGSPMVIFDITEEPRLLHLAGAEPPARSLVMVPIRTSDLTGAVGAWWDRVQTPSDDVVDLLLALANTTEVMLENISLYEDLERRVAERTAQLARANSELEALTLTDDLTGLNNRRGFATLVTQELKVLSRSHRPGLLLYLDVDDLKSINDRRGHDVGDQLLRRVANGISATVRAADVSARIGGDEFAVFLPDTEGDTQPLLDRIRDAIATCPEDQPEMSTQVSIGTAAFEPADPVSLDTLLSRADAAMYRDKQQRRAQWPGSSPHA